MFNPWPLVWADLRRTRAGTLAIVLLVALAVGLGVAVSAQERALREGSARAADAFDLLIGARGSEAQLVLSTVYLQPAAIELISGRLLVEIGARPEVAYAAPIGIGDNWRGHPIVGSTVDFATQGGRLALAEGRVFQRLDEVVLGADVPLGLDERFAPAHGLPVGHFLDEARVWPHGPAGEPDLGAVPLGLSWQEGELPGVPAIVVKPASFAAAYSLRSRSTVAAPGPVGGAGWLRPARS